MTERVRLGQTDIEVSALGVGTWQWGDRRYWGYGREYGEAEVEAAFRASTDAGVNFFDTAELYSFGGSERLLSRFVRGAGDGVCVATKFMPYPWRWTRHSLINALRGSLERLGLDRVGLYQVHMPFPPRAAETWAATLADAVEAGLTEAVGVSNYRAGQMRQAHEVLAHRGVPLASNQIALSLLDRKAEREGVLDACRELGVTPIAYSPLAQGMLTGKYSSEKQLPGIRRVSAAVRRAHPKSGRARHFETLIGTMREIGEKHGGKMPAQVALNWVICKGALPIPGAKNAEQARSNGGALGWRLTDEEVTLLDEESARV